MRKVDFQSVVFTSEKKVFNLKILTDKTRDLAPVFLHSVEKDIISFAITMKKTYHICILYQYHSLEIGASRQKKKKLKTYKN